MFEAAWAITNMAAGPPESAAAVLPAAPMLILLLRCASTHVAEQSAWALGKIPLPPPGGNKLGVRDARQKLVRQATHLGICFCAT